MSYPWYAVASSLVFLSACLGLPFVFLRHCFAAPHGIPEEPLYNPFYSSWACLQLKLVFPGKCFVIPFDISEGMPQTAWAFLRKCLVRIPLVLIKHCFEIPLYSKGNAICFRFPLVFLKGMPQATLGVNKGLLYHPLWSS